MERKLGRDIDSQAILADFDPSRESRLFGESVCNSNSTIVATSYTTGDSADGVMQVEYLNRAELEDFLLKRTHRRDGFLQRWVWSAGKFNSVIQVIWAPHLTLVSRRENKIPVHDRRYPLYDRGVTFEGPPFYSEEALVAPHIRYQVEAACKGMVQHLFVTHKIAVRRIVLYFKVDHHGDLWFLWSSSIRVHSNLRLNLTPRCVRARTEEEEEQRTAGGITRLLRATLPNPPRPPASMTPKCPSRPQTSRPIATSPGRLDTIRHPKPPSMGPIGDIYHETPQWLIDHRRVMARARKRNARRGTAPNTAHFPRSAHSKRNKGAGSNGMGPTLPQRKALPPHDRAKNAAGGDAAPESAESNQDALANAGPRCAGNAQRLWRVVRSAVFTGWGVVALETNAVRDFLESLVYGAYSHFLCTPTPMPLAIPPLCEKYMGSPVEWLPKLGFQLVESNDALTDSPPPRPILHGGTDCRLVRVKLAALVVEISSRSDALYKELVVPQRQPRLDRFLKEALQ